MNYHATEKAGVFMCW